MSLPGTFLDAAAPAFVPVGKSTKSAPRRKKRSERDRRNRPIDQRNRRSESQPQQRSRGYRPPNKQQRPRGRRRTDRRHFSAAEIAHASFRYLLTPFAESESDCSEIVALLRNPNAVPDWESVVAIGVDTCESLRCPISLDTVEEMACPVITPCGHVYELPALLRHLSTVSACPICNYSVTRHHNLPSVSVQPVHTHRAGDRVTFQLMSVGQSKECNTLTELLHKACPTPVHATDSSSGYTETLLSDDVSSHRVTCSTTEAVNAIAQRQEERLHLALYRHLTGRNRNKVLDAETLTHTMTLAQQAMNDPDVKFIMAALRLCQRRRSRLLPRCAPHVPLLSASLASTPVEDSGTRLLSVPVASGSSDSSRFFFQSADGQAFFLDDLDWRMLNQVPELPTKFEAVVSEVRTWEDTAPEGVPRAHLPRATELRTCCLNDSDLSKLGVTREIRARFDAELKERKRRRNRAKQQRRTIDRRAREHEERERQKLSQMGVYIPPPSASEEKTASVAQGLYARALQGERKPLPDLPSLPTRTSTRAVAPVASVARSAPPLAQQLTQPELESSASGSGNKRSQKKRAQLRAQEMRRLGLFL
ncbi:MAG: hypothetical protein MHM6MM_005545 [Cercozoa sp. M6MM]